MIVDELENVRLFQDLDSQSLEEIAEFCTTMDLSDGDILISENDKQNNDLFILVSGNVEIISSSDSVTSSEVSLSKSETLSNAEKETFGEISWLSGLTRTATIRSHGDIEVICIDGAKLQNYLESNHHAGYHVMRAIAIMLAEAMNETNMLLKQVLWNDIT